MKGDIFWKTLEKYALITASTEEHIIVKKLVIVRMYAVH